MKKIKIKNNEFLLMPEKAIYWQEEKTLLVSDLHLGKSDTFRHSGIYVPTGTTSSDLDRLNKLIYNLNIRRIIFLGDLLHHRSGYNTKVKNALKEWRDKNKNIEIILIRGNHDLKAGDPELSLDFICKDEPYNYNGFEFRHFPPKNNSEYCFAGHIHPSVILKGKGNQYLKLPCFYFSEKYSLLPSFGSFTGSSKIKVKKGDKVFVITLDKVLEIKDRMD